MNDKLYRIGFAAAFMLAVLLAFYSGFRLPNGWAVYYYKISWLDGFFRRGLLGTLLYPLGCLRFHYPVIAAAQFLVLAALIALSFYCGTKFKAFLILIIYFASAAGGYLFNEVGYSEQILWLVAATGLYALHRNHVRLTALLLVIAILIHEMSVLTVLPLAFAYLCIYQRLRIKLLLALLIPPCAVFAVMYLFFQTVPEATIHVFAARSTICGYPLSAANKYLELYRYDFQQRMQNYFTLPQLFSAAVLMVVAAMVSLGSTLPLFLRALISLCAISPLLLGFGGWDTYRWLFITFTTIVIIRIILLSRFVANRNGQWFNTALLLVAFCLNYHYFGGEKPRPIDYSHFASFWKDAERN